MGCSQAIKRKKEKKKKKIPGVLHEYFWLFLSKIIGNHAFFFPFLSLPCNFILKVKTLALLKCYFTLVQ